MRKLLLCASLALAVGAFAVPSGASASWTLNHQHLEANAQIHEEGTIQWTSPVGGFHCAQVTATATLTAGTTTTSFSQLNPVLSSCKTTAGLAQCTITSITIENLPWTGHINGTWITMTGVTIQHHLHGTLCPSTLQFQTTQQHHMILTGEEIGSTEGHATISGLKQGGQLRIKETNQTATVSGTFVPTGSDTSKYGWT